MIAVIDYGMGNLRSVQKALEAVGARTLVTSKPADLDKCDKLVFPGVGSFGAAMKELKRLGLVDPIRKAIEEGKPFLGLCLGLQLLFEKSEEAPGVRGLCILDGDVRRFKGPGSGVRGPALKVPHMGWNSIVKGSRVRGPGSRIMKGVPDGSFVYFIHSYYVKPKEKRVILTTTDYGKVFVSGICRDNIFGFQFHPEKSQALGLKILRNFVELCNV